jgi:hypothetical protein
MELMAAFRILSARRGCPMEDVMRVQDAWEKAAACEAHAERSEDRKLQGMFRKLRDSWIRIANNTQFAGDVAQNEERLKTGEGR